MPVQNSAEFFSELKEWSERKLKILEKYLDPFTKIVSSQYDPNVYYIDGFAGAGIYDKDGSAGSAIRAAELALQYQQQAKSYRLQCINIEADPRNYANLEENTQQFDDLVLNLSGTFVNNIDQILSETAHSPALCFLDPFGIKGIDNWSVIQRLIHRGAPTDFWIRFDHITLFRLAGFFDSSATSADKYLEILCETYGISDREVLYKAIMQGDTIAEKRINAVKLYTSRLIEEFTFARGKGYSAYYPIKSITGQDKYFLVFATGHIKGAIVASELLCSIEETYQREVEEYQSSKPRQLSLFDTTAPTEDEIFQDKVERLQLSIQRTCSGKRLSRAGIYERILPEWFGKIRFTHMTHAIKMLQNNGMIIDATGAPSDKNTIFTFR